MAKEEKKKSSKMGDIKIAAYDSIKIDQS